MYCPWDVINYVDELNYDQAVEPQDYWSNSSGNAIVRRLIDKADVQTKDEIERLIAGECIEKELSQELTYDELDKTLEICGAYFYDRISDKTGAYSGWKDTFGNS